MKGKPSVPCKVRLDGLRLHSMKKKLPEDRYKYTLKKEFVNPYPANVENRVSS